MEQLYAEMTKTFNQLWGLLLTAGKIAREYASNNYVVTLSKCRSVEHSRFQLAMNQRLSEPTIHFQNFLPLKCCPRKINHE
jgi:hypothetical protein